MANKYKYNHTFEDKRIEDANAVYAKFPGIHDRIFLLK